MPGNPPSAEIDCHGGVVAVQRVLESFVRRGARAVPAEASLDSAARSQIATEAARALIQATTPLGVEILLDQLDGALERALDASAQDDATGFSHSLRQLLATERLGRALWQPRTVALIGPTNAGKSTLFNGLAREDRMIVSPIPGTTRDAVSAEVAIGGLPVWLTDTAGERVPGSEIEAEAIARGRQAAAAADLALLVADGSVDAAPSLAALLSPPPPRLVVLNKADLGLAPWTEAHPEAIRISAERGDGLEMLCERIVVALVGEASYKPGRPVVFAERQAASLRRAEQAASSGAIGLARDIITGLLLRTS